MARAAHQAVPVMAPDENTKEPGPGPVGEPEAPQPAAPAGARRRGHSRPAVRPPAGTTAAVAARADSAFARAAESRTLADAAFADAMAALRFTGEGTRGLTLERRWTRPGVHPYDEVAWEVRTASIGSEAGKVVFEQKDVEVPAFWSQLATNVVVSKYFRGHLGTPERETSVRQLIDRVVTTLTAWAESQRYFATDEDLDAFRAELSHLLVHQKMSFNSPVWFNVGIEPRPQCSACFINSVSDSMVSIMDLAKTEAMLFKYGSGAGSNLSTIRSSREKMAGGGTASGPVSFMKGYDSFAGVVKSGGKTRRAAKMVILDVDHPDILDFVDSKMLEEKKAWALIEQGYDPSFTGEAYGSVFFQNANHSVRVTDEFMQAVVDDRPWTTHAVTDGRPMDTMPAASIFRRMAEAAWLCGDPGIQYDTTINAWNPVANSARQHATNPCSEFSFINDSSCNLASLNLMRFVGEDGELDVEAFRYAARLTIIAQEIIVDNASYPTPKIAENSHRFRPLGLGYANLGALLMSRGLGYDSPEGRNYAAAVTAIMHGEAYRQSAVIARDHGGPFVEFEKNREPFLGVIEMHVEASRRIPARGVPAAMLEAARQVNEEALELGRVHGYRNAQVTLLAPTGTIAFMMDCDTTGIEPDIALVKYKKLVGEGYLKIVNNTVPLALRRLGYTPEQVEEIDRFIEERETIEGAPGLRPEHLPVFDCAFKPVNGVRAIDHMGHVRMMAAVQPFLSGAISKTVNMPETATPEDIEQVYLEGWRMGLKAIAIYRDNSKRSQPLSTGKKKDTDEAAASEVVEDLRRRLAEAQAEATKPHRHRLPAERTAVTHKFEVSGHEGYIIVGLYPDGQPGEIFLKMAKEGSTVSGLMDAFATAISLALQYGVPLRDLVNKFAHVRFEPAGFTANSEIPIAKSTIDYIFRWLGSRFLSAEDKATLGIVDRGTGSSGISMAPTPALAGPAAPAVRLPDAAAYAPAAEEGPLAIDEALEGRDEADPPRATAVATVEVRATEPPATEPPATGRASLPAAGQAGRNGGAPSSNGKQPATGASAAAFGAERATFRTQADAPSCADCGSIMVRNGSCYKCLNCGSTSGCS
ncbi:MAG: Ribonucleotide reductase of class (coenzyme B12-dependent) [Chloroflexi bacterium]|nr:Ribonucleotide reductase of class (coenzyme B12-dependent) [Chloroflexota bacterium]